MPGTNEGKTIVTELSTEPTVLHQGRYRLYEKPDGGLHIVYQRDDKDTPDHMDLPGAMIRLAQAAGEGKMNPMQLIAELTKMRGSM